LAISASASSWPPQLEQHGDAIERAIDVPAPAGRTAIPANVRAPPAAPPMRRPARDGRARGRALSEPIVRIKEARTVYSRASLAEPGADGLYPGAQKTRPSISNARQVVPVARHFAPATAYRHFLPVVAGLLQRRGVHRPLDLIRRERDVAGGLVVDITQKDPPPRRAASKALAWLAELGAAFRCPRPMSRTRYSRPLHLGPVHRYRRRHHRQGGDGLQPVVREPACGSSQAGEHGVSVIAANVAGERELEAVLSYSSLARGPLF
jgi:hypothetical protein